MTRKKRKLIDLVNHREHWYFKTLDDLIDGKVSPAYTAQRWHKYKDVKFFIDSL